MNGRGWGLKTEEGSWEEGQSEVNNDYKIFACLRVRVRNELQLFFPPFLRCGLTPSALASLLCLFKVCFMEVGL